MKNMGLLALTLAILLSACTTSAPPTALGEEIHPCGDGICRGPENSRNCPADCPSEASPPDHQETSTEGDQPGEYWITNPTSGSRLYVRIITAETWDGAASPTLVLVPGGIGDSTSFTEGRNDAQELAEQGFTVVVFDPDGRGQSEGEEDKNGHTHQDGLAEIIRSIAEFPSVDADRIGVLSYSYGITMASGTLARYPDLPVQFLIDWEGPANREDTTHGCIPGAPGAGSIEFMSDCDDEAFWSEREAQTFIAQISQYYQRVQSEQDHSQPDSSNAIDMINAAVEGGVPWVRLNDLPANQTYDETSLPPMLPESTDRHLASLMGEFAIEILALVP